jgi:hypothetical protein
MRRRRNKYNPHLIVCNPYLDRTTILHSDLEQIYQMDHDADPRIVSLR